MWSLWFSTRKLDLREVHWMKRFNLKLFRLSWKHSLKSLISYGFVKLHIFSRWQGMGRVLSALSRPKAWERLWLFHGARKLLYGCNGSNRVVQTHPINTHVSPYCLQNISSLPSALPSGSRYVGQSSPQNSLGRFLCRSFTSRHHFLLPDVEILRIICRKGN